jgi:adenosylcobinamide-GDP ribazoletransferase
MNKILRGFITAMRTLTVLRLPGRDALSLAAALPWFPLVGCFVSAAVGLVLDGVMEWLHWSSGAAVLAVLTSVLLTGGLHLDGLADTVDGWRGGRTRERRLDIMKDSRIGAMGAMALILVLLLQMVALARLAGVMRVALLLLPLAYILSRLAMVLLAVSLPYARAGGGTAEQFVKDARGWHFIVALLLAAALCGLLAGPVGLVAVFVALLVTLALRLWMRNLFGGVTGDLLGCASVVVETVLLFLLGAVAPRLGPLPLLF